MNYGIDYGMGQSNIDENGIHYGVIPSNDVLQAWADSSEGDYGAPTCGECGNEALPIDDESIPDIDSAEDWQDEGRDYACLNCKRSFWADEAYGDESLAYILDDGEYKAECDSMGDIFILKSPFYTFAQYCSPCAPGACYLRNVVDEKGPRAYCFSPEWFDCWDDEQSTGEFEGRKTSCPYPVYRVADGACIFTPKG